MTALEPVANVFWVSGTNVIRLENLLVMNRRRKSPTLKKALKAKTKAKEFYNAVDDEADGDDIPF